MNQKPHSAPEPKLHYAPSPKRALCGLKNPRAAYSPEDVTCRYCKRWMRHLPVGKPSRRHPNGANPKAPHGHASTLVPDPPKQFFKKLGQRIRLLRTKKGLTRAQLATSCRLWTGHVGKIERGDHNITLITLMRIASRLGISAKALLAASLVDVGSDHHRHTQP